ncbi:MULTISPECIES: ABC transporter ATP-binding protein [Actinomadura]|uniref:Branched-chain amino acid transport system ATP-binding protein n=1 Tax=Actinomadura madurae TaxID=1993 RepID=A0A1I5F6A4_9ACTN|nr:ABC transporter ATP-binding protein [Actinomadura madurae]SFO19308.1 branched-chain amino acid transport system ATP-binding protein [Actinomadura madurae]
MLEIRNVSVRFGGLQVLDDVSLALPPGRVTGVIGPNGAGKTTLFDCVTGFVRRDTGTIRVDGRAVPRTSPHRAARAGIARTFQTPRMFGGLTTLENLVVAGSRPSAVRSLVLAFRSRAHSAELRGLAALAEETGVFMGLAPVLDQRSDALSGGQRKLLEIGRALMREPRVLLLDEPMAGVHPSLAGTIATRMRAVADRGLAVGVIEHNMEFVMTHCDHVHVLARGKELAHGEPDVVRKDPRVLEAYLGGRP